MIDFDTFTNNCCQRLEKLPKVQKIAQSGHTGNELIQSSKETMIVPKVFAIYSATVSTEFI